MARSGRAPGSNVGSKTPWNWRLLVLVLGASTVLIWTCGQLILLGNDCLAERERAVHAEDLVLKSQAVREESRQAFERQVADLKKQLAEAATPASPSPPSKGDAEWEKMVHGLQAEIERLRKENFRLKASSQGSTAQVEMVHNEPQRHAQALSTAELTEDLLKSLASNGAIGVAIVTCKRPKYLSRTMDSVLRAQRDPAKFPLVISQDANDAAMQELVQRSFVKTGQAYHMHHEHDPNAPAIATKYGGKKAIGYVRIAQHFGFVMRRMFDEFGFEAVIFLEEDLEISPDFFSYFGAMRTLLRGDTDLFCVSAWNDNGYSTLVQDPKVAYRTDFFPGLGWMMDRDLWGELRNRWAVAYWDEFMRRPDVRKGRHCIRPEISRSFTFGEEGVSGGQFFKQHLGKIKLNDVVVDWSKQDLSHLASAEAFDDYLTAQIRTAAVVSIENIDSFAGQSKVLRIEYEDAKYKAVAQKFSLMPDEKEGIRRMSYRGVIPLSWHTNRVYLHARTWPPGLPN